MITKIISVFLLSSTNGWNINDIGKIYDNDESEAAEKHNAEVFSKAFKRINDSPNEDRTLWVPSENDFSMFPVNATGLHNVTLKIDGNIRATKNYKEWPHEGNAYLHFIHLMNCTDIKFEGQGIIDG